MTGFVWERTVQDFVHGVEQVVAKSLHALGPSLPRLDEVVYEDIGEPHRFSGSEIGDGNGFLFLLPVGRSTLT